MRLTLTLTLFVALLIPDPLWAQGPEDVTEIFKLGTFEIEGAPRIGIVLRDSLIVDLNEANAALESNRMYPVLPMPADMKELISRYEYGLKARLYEIVNNLVLNTQLTGSNRPDYVHDVDSLRTLPPIIYPGKILNAAVNFYSHVDEQGAPEERAEARRGRRENRGVPYLFLKPPEGAVIGNGDSVVLPYGRTRIDWEVELAAVIGRASKYVPADEAEDHIFGYTVSLDISDRGGAAAGRKPAAVGLVRLQGTRHLRPDGAVDHSEGILRQSHGDSPADVEHRRHSDAGSYRGRHDPLPLGTGGVCVLDRDALSGRRDQQRDVRGDRRRHSGPR